MLPAQTPNRNVEGPGFLRLSTVRRLLHHQGESQGPPGSRCRMFGGLPCRENAKVVDVLERLVSRHNVGRGLERMNRVDTDSYTALEMKRTQPKSRIGSSLQLKRIRTKCDRKQRLLAVRIQRRQVTMTRATKILNKLNLIRLTSFFL